MTTEQIIAIFIGGLLTMLTWFIKRTLDNMRADTKEVSKEIKSDIKEHFNSIKLDIKEINNHFIALNEKVTLLNAYKDESKEDINLLFEQNRTQEERLNALEKNCFSNKKNCN